MLTIPLDKVLNKANEYLDARDFKAANVLFGLIQQEYPELPDVLHGMGVLALLCGQLDVAEQLLQRSLRAFELLPNKSELKIVGAKYLAHLAQVEIQKNKLAWATMHLLESLRCEENSQVREWLNLAVEKSIHQSRENLAPFSKKEISLKNNLAAVQLRNILDKKSKGGKNSKDPDARKNFLVEKISIFLNSSTYEDAKKAEAYCCELLTIQPKNYDALHWLGIIKHRLNEPNEAIKALQFAISNHPNYSYIYNTLGVVQRSIGLVKEAINNFHIALKLNPYYAEAGMNLGNVLRDERLFNESIAWYRWAVFHKPVYPEAWNNIGILNKQSGERDDALFCFNKVIELDPRYAKAYLNIGILYEESRQRKLSIEFYQKALKISPNVHEIRLSMIHQKLNLCDWTELDEQINFIRQLICNNYSGEMLPFNFMSLPGVTPAEQKQCAITFAKSRYENFIKQAKNIDVDFDRKSKSILNIGFVSADFREHAVAISIVEMIELFDRNRYKVFGYSYGKDELAPTRNRLKNSFDVFVDIDLLSYSEAAERIYKDKIDILIDLTGYTANGRSEIFALRPAPIQVSYLGFSGTTGASYIDYLVGDPVITPFEYSDFYTEKLALLPDCFFPFDRTRAVSELRSRADEGLPDSSFIFCSFNQSYKINPALWKTWCGILNEVPNSVIWLHNYDKDAKDSLITHASKYGIAKERIIFADLKKNLSDHLSRLRLADLALDTIPYGGHTTTGDALWVGLPTLTCLGLGFHSRVAASMLSALGLHDLICLDLDSYAKKAVEIGKNSALFNEIKSRLTLNRDNYPLFDTLRLTKNFEKLMEKMMENWISGKSPAAIKLDA